MKHKAAITTLAVMVMVVALALPTTIRAEDLCTLSGGTNIKAPPDFNVTLHASFSLTVEMTSLKENTTYYVTEVHERRPYHEDATDTGGVSLRHNGSSLAFQYYPLRDMLVRESGGECAEMPEQPKIAWGWWDKDPAHGAKSFGPSSILRLANVLKTEQMGSVTGEGGVRVDVWKACADNGRVEITFQYSAPPWSMPDGSWFSGVEASLPVSMDVKFVDESEHWFYNFVEFLPFAAPHSLLEPPRGMACEGITGVMNRTVPIIPNHFSLAQEEILNSLVDGRDFGTQYMDKIQVTYAGEISLVSFLATLHYDIEYSTAYAVKIIHDFNTGVQYTVYKEFGNCSKNPIPPFTFDAQYGGFLGNGDSLLSPNGMFHLDDKYAFVGERVSRDILGDLWTSTRLDDIPDPATGGFQNFAKAVQEYYFSQGAEKTPSGDFAKTDLPFRSDLFIYNTSNPEQIVATGTSNYYDFRVVDMFSPDEFSVESCYEKYSDNWSYLDIFFPVTQNNQMIAASEEQTRFKHEVMLKLIEIGRLSPVRLASIDVNTGVSGLIPNTTNVDMVIAKVKLLERAPYIFSYRQPPGEMDPQPGKKQSLFPNIRSMEDCAIICSTNTDIECKSFYHCGSDCYPSQFNGPDGDALNVEGGCQHWVYDLQNKTLDDNPSQIVYKSVFEAVKRGDFHFSVPYRNNSGGANYEAKMSIHYRTPDPMDPVRKQFTLEDTMMTVRFPNDTIKVGDLTECMLLCVGWVRYRCETIIHQSEEKLCLLLSLHYHELDHTDLVPHSNSFVHGRSYLVDYSPILGGVALNTTGPVYSPVEHLESCARYCSMETSIACQSFEYCPSNQMCHLHAEHFLDVVNDGNYITGTACIHFSRKSDGEFTKYEDQGLAPSQHQKVAHMSSPSACAKMCIEDEKEVCQSYDFCSICDKNSYAVCGEENKLGIGLCFLATHHLGESGLALQTGKGCDHYDRDVFGNLDYAAWVSRQRKSDNPYTPGDMTGLAFGMIFMGILLAVGFLVAITSFKPDAMPKDLELNFQKLKTSGESSI